jgi:hypothetical protein
VRIVDWGDDLSRRVFPVGIRKGEIDGQLPKSDVAVEKLSSGKFVESAMRQDALQTIFSGRLDIFYPQNLR